MAPGPLFGSPVSVGESLGSVAAQLSEWFDPLPTAGTAVRLGAVEVGLPEVTLSYQRDRRLFSRTLQLVVEASAPGAGPPGDATRSLRSRRLRRRAELEWSDGPTEDEAGTIGRFVRAGVVAGARTMTNVRDLELSWSASEQTWRIRLVTLAGALIGTSPGAAITVPLEPEDVSGLLALLRGFVAAASGS